MNVSDRNNIRKRLFNKLKEEYCFWSYDAGSIDSINDDMLIEETMRHLDIDEINLLFKLYPYSKVKRVWLDRLVPEGEYLFSINRLFAWYYFNAKKPTAYVKSMATRYFNRHFS